MLACSNSCSRLLQTVNAAALILIHSIASSSLECIIDLHLDRGIAVLLLLQWLILSSHHLNHRYDIALAICIYIVVDLRKFLLLTVIDWFCQSYNASTTVFKRSWLLFAFHVVFLWFAWFAIRRLFLDITAVLVLRWSCLLLVRDILSGCIFLWSVL